MEVPSLFATQINRNYLKNVNKLPKTGPKWLNVKTTKHYNNQRQPWLTTKPFSVQELNVPRHYKCTRTLRSQWFWNDPEQKLRTNTVSIENMGGPETCDSLTNGYIVYPNATNVSERTPYTSTHIKLTDITLPLVHNDLRKNYGLILSIHINWTVRRP